MYTLTLTREERKAIDWVGHRYSNGTDLYKVLWNTEVSIIPSAPADSQWDDQITFTFRIPEHLAWQIVGLAEADDNMWPCFAHELKAKMTDFVDQVV